jgi:uncharacterized protein (DUF111 family)
MNPEIFGFLMEKLLGAGAADVFFTPIYMKKNRPGTLLTVVSNLADHKPFLDIIFTETTSLGVRMHQVNRYKLSRAHTTVDTPYGPVRVKIGLDGDNIINIAPEYDDCKALADKACVPLKDIYQEALAIFHSSSKNPL